jgi:hypothetical protein
VTDTRTPSRSKLRFAIHVALVLLVVVAVRETPASSPAYFELEDRRDVEKGNADGVSIADNGALALAPSFEMSFDTKQTYVWSSAVDARGTVYLGTGHDGKVFAVDAAGKGRELLDTNELDVTALAVDPSGAVFAATSPDGKVYRIAPDGTSSVYFDPDDKYVWSLALRDGVLYAGTGEKGIIYRVTAAGKGEPWVDTDEVHVIAMAFTAKGELIAGTDPGALVLRIGSDGKPFTLFDSPLQETHALRVAPDGTIYALAIASSAATTSSEQTSISTGDASTTTSRTSIDLSTLGMSDVKSRRDTSDAKSAVYRIAPDGSSDVMWNSKSIVGYAIVLDGSRLLVGTGDRGRIVAVEPTTLDTTVLVQSYEDQTSTLLAVGNALYATTNTVGRLFKLGPGTAAKGTYEAPVHDAKAVSRWGRLRLRNTSGATVEARSGNTETPDTTWSEWSAVRLEGDSGLVASPPARYLQWRLTLTGASARVQSVGISYIPRNVAPEVAQLAIMPAGIGLQETPTQAIDPGILNSGFDPSIFGLSTNLPPRRVYQRGARSLVWQVKDPDDERLAYDLYYRTLGDAAWHPLARGLDTNWYTVDSDALPDGVYVFRLVADDSPSNPAQFGLKSEKTSEAIEIDNTPPGVTSGQPTLRADGLDVVFTATDSTGRITRGAYSVDGGPWISVYPDDGVPDDRRESFRVSVAGLVRGEHLIAFRVSDNNLNVGSAKLTVQIGSR